MPVTMLRLAAQSSHPKLTMCGRFTLRTPAAELVEIFDLISEPNWVARYNIAPTQSVLAVRNSEEGRQPLLLTWGLVPSWAKDPSIGSRMINARAETVATKPSFRAAFRRRRCLILADGFYEWQKTSGKTKQPHFIGLEGDRPFAFAGLWEHWPREDGSELLTCTIITTDANDLLEDLHDRMPVILNPSDYDVWLDRDVEDREALEGLLRPYESEEMRYYPISRLVNNPRNDEPQCVEPEET